MEMTYLQSLLKLAYEEAKQSYDPSTQAGALLIDANANVLLHDWNRPPSAIKRTNERWQKPLKYKVCEHAERNVIYAAAHLGIKTRNLIMVCPWMPCCDCARAIIISGIRMLITHKQAYDRTPERWKEDQQIAYSMLNEAGVVVMMYDGTIGVTGVRFNGELWNP